MKVLLLFLGRAIAERERLYKMSENSLKISKELFDWQIHKKTLLAVIMGDQQTIEEKAKEVGVSALSSSYDLQDMERNLLKLNEYSKALEKITGDLAADKNALETDKKALEENKIILLQTIDTLEEGKNSRNAQIETIQSNLELVLNSKSWKITKPVRAFRKILTK